MELVESLREILHRLFLLKRIQDIRYNEQPPRRVSNAFMVYNESLAVSFFFKHSFVTSNEFSDVEGGPRTGLPRSFLV